MYIYIDVNTACAYTHVVVVFMRPALLKGKLRASGPVGTVNLRALSCKASLLMLTWVPLKITALWESPDDYASPQATPLMGILSAPFA